MKKLVKCKYFSCGQFNRDRMAISSKYTNDATFRLTMPAYIMLNLLRQQVLLIKIDKSLSASMFLCVTIDLYQRLKNDKKVLKLPDDSKCRHFTEHIFGNVDRLEPPFKFSNA